ncbi:MAG TPA: sulfotransferase [Rhodanobacteraceae bacterium]|nr:sulfotransferase [Rhodanobacteraceae bacterium]
MTAGTACAALLSRAERGLAAGRFAEAERDVAGALALDPDDTRALKLSAALLQRRGRIADAIAALRRAATTTPDDPLLLNSLGIALAASDTFAEAIATLGRAFARAPDNAVIAANLGKMLVDSGAVDDGVATLRKALARAPDMTHARFTLAYAERARGKLAEAETELRAILQRNAHDGDAWLALADLGVRASAGDIATMQAALDDTRVAGRSRIALRFALARALEEASRCDEAWPHYLEANRDVRGSEPWDAATDRQRCDALMQALDASPATAPDDLGREVVFIVGLPRSGSTLIEQILASHADVAAGGELGTLSLVLDAESHRQGVAIETWAPRATASDWERLGRDYLARTAHVRADRSRSTDKRPGNWRYLDAIRRMLPGARIVVARRDPVETALGCFVRLFAPRTQRFSYDLDDIASYWQSFDAGVRHARERGALREQHVEALVADGEREIRALLDFCGLPFDPKCLRFDETERAIRTQSAAQVRGGLRAGTPRAACYRAHIDPLRRALNLADS